MSPFTPIRSAVPRLPVLAAAALAGALVIAGCGGGAEDPAPSAPTTAATSTTTAAADAEPNGSDVLAAFGLEAVSAVEVVDQLDATKLADRDQDLFASVRPGGLLVRGADGAEETVPLPADQFYLSFAPYVAQTHECFYHSLTTCVGELQNAQIDLTIVNDGDGTVVVDESVTTFDNGFYGLWLPAGEQFTLTVDFDGKAVTAPIGTGPEDPTCVTTLQLS